MEQPPLPEQICRNSYVSDQCFVTANARFHENLKLKKYCKIFRDYVNSDMSIVKEERLRRSSLYDSALP